LPAIVYGRRMLIKWVRCRVADREAFHRGQLAWAGLRGMPGFRGQCGGWSRHDPDRAHILGFWADEPSYRAFMAGAHDRLAAAQIGSYAELEVRLFDRPEIAPSIDFGARMEAIAGEKVELEPAWTVPA